MARKMTRRERITLIVTIAVVVGAVIYHFGAGEEETASGGSWFVDREELKQARETYDRYEKFLRRKPEIDQGFDALEEQYQIDEQADKEFTAKVEKAFKDIQMNPNIAPAQYEELYEGAGEYGVIKHSIRADADTERVGRMLIFCDQHLIRIDDLLLTGQLGNPRITVTVTISQMVKLSPENREKAKANSKKRGGSGGRTESTSAEDIL